MANFVPDPTGFDVEDFIEELSNELSLRYREVEDTLIRELADRVYRDIELQSLLPTETVAGGLTAAERRQQNRTLGQLAVHRRQALRELQSEATAMVEKMRRSGMAEEIIRVAAQEGEAAAAARLGLATRLPTVYQTGSAGQAVASLAISLQSRLEVMNQRITRYPKDAYQRVVSMTSPQTIVGTTTGLVQQQETVRRFLSEGITGFVDEGGRRWTIGAYSEMAGRTSVNRAFNDAGQWRMQQSGVNLVTIVGSFDACVNCAPWIGKILSTDGTPAGPRIMPHSTQDSSVPVNVSGTIEQAKNAGLFHPNCFPSFVPVGAPTGVVGADSRWFEGEVVVIDTAGGRRLTVTPNHPILTTEGWVAAGLLTVGHNVLSYHGNVERVPGSGPDHEGVETPIGEVFETLRQSSSVATVTMPGSAEQFHGDGFDSEVHVVLADRLLRTDGEAETFELSADGQFLVSSVGLSPLFPHGTLSQVVQGALSATEGIVGGAGPFGSLIRGGCVHTALHGLAGSDLDTGLLEPVLHATAIDTDEFPDLMLGEPFSGVEPDSFVQPVGIDPALLDGEIVCAESTVENVPADVDGGRYLANSLTGLVSADRIVKVERRAFAGHVYNLQSGDGWYTADSIVVHNCRDRTVAMLPGLSVPQQDFEYDKKAEGQRTRQRSIERDIRAAKRDAATAPDAMARKRAERAVRDGQEKMRGFLGETGRSRSGYREQLHFSDGK